MSVNFCFVFSDSDLELEYICMYAVMLLSNYLYANEW